MNSNIHLRGKVSQGNIEFAESKLLESAEEYEKFLDSLIDEKNLYKYTDYESIIKQLGFDITRRTVNYYIEEELLDQMIKQEGKKIGYLTSKHIYRYICIAIIQNSLVLQLKDIKNILNHFSDEILKQFVVSYLVTNEEVTTQLKYVMKEQAKGKDDKLIFLMGNMNNIVAAKNFLLREISDIFKL